MLDEGPDGFEGGMNARKYISITKTSKATATRDMQPLDGNRCVQTIRESRRTQHTVSGQSLKQKTFLGNSSAL